MPLFCVLAPVEAQPPRLRHRGPVNVPFEPTAPARGAFVVKPLPSRGCSGDSELGLERELCRGVELCVDAADDVCWGTFSSFRGGWIKLIAVPGPIPPLQRRKRAIGEIAAVALRDDGLAIRGSKRQH